MNQPDEIFQLDEACSRFESAWSGAEEPPDLRMLLDSAEDRNRASLFRLLLPIDIEHRRRRSIDVDVEFYRKQFSEYPLIINAEFGCTDAGVPDTVTVNQDSSIDKEHDFSADMPETIDSAEQRNAAPQKEISRPDPPRRKQVGRYTILGTLGRGGQADVYRGVHPTLPIEVAIKLTHQSLSDNARAALQEEAHILCDLDHPHIARIRDFDFDDGRPFMVLDFIRGRSLGQVAASQSLTPSEAATLVSQLAHAIGYAHARGVIHRDLKPDNVVINESGEPKIIDFGMSQLRAGIAGPVKHPDEVSGTLAYMAPEQAVGVTSKTDHRVDIFSLGAILYRLLVGSAPYPVLPVQQLLDRVRRSDWDREALESASVPEPLKEICRKALDVEISNRYHDATEMGTALDDFGASSPDPSADLPQNRSWMGLALAALVLVLLGGIAWWSTRPSIDRPKAANVEPGDSQGEDSQGDVSQGDVSQGASQIKSFNLIHIGNSAGRAEFSGSLMEFRAPRENDDIQVMAEFTEPVYCFLVALNPDGVKQPCFPKDRDQPQSEPITRLRYPDQENAAFGLTDGAGSQAFVLYTSREPLPSYNQWNESLESTVWPNPNVSGNWAYAQGELITLAATDFRRPTRGPVRETKTPTPFKELCDRLQESESADVQGVIFDIQPSDEL